MWDLFLETFSSVGSLTSKISLIDIFFFLFIGLFNITRINQLFRWGRRISFLLMIYMAVTLSIATAFSPNYTVYMVFRAINGLTFPALFQIPYILGKSIIFNLTNKTMATINLDCKNTLNTWNAVNYFIWNHQYKYEIKLYNQILLEYYVVMELVGPEFRTFAGNGISMFFGLSLALLAGLAHFLRHWFHLALATSVPFLPLFG